MNYALSIAVLAAISTGAQAGYDPSSTAFDRIVRVSGSSASDNGLFDRVDVDMCVANGNKSYLVQSGNATTSLGNYWGVACDASAASGITGKVLFLKRSAGGSAMGVGPVNASTQIGFIDRSSCTDADSNGVYTCPQTTDITTPPGNVPNGGVSDVNPSGFTAPINGGNGASYLNLVVQPLVTQVFGIVVNTSFRNALQAAQFGSGSSCVGQETEACMPSLTKNQINTIFTVEGQQQSWSDFVVNRVGGSDPITTSPATAAYRATPFDSKIHICRRVIGSGTQAQFQFNFLDNPSKTGTNTLTPYHQYATNFTTGPIVWNGSGSGDVEACLESYENGVTKTITAAAAPTGTTTISRQINPALSPATGAQVETGPVHAWAIGIQGTEKNNTLSKAYRFIKVDGVAPTIENVWNGKYFDFAESSCQVRKNDTTAEALFVKKLCNLSPNTVAKLNLGPDLNYVPQGNGSGEHTWGVGGYLLPSTIPGAVPDTSFNLLNPVTNYTRENNPGRQPVINKQYRTKIPFNSGNTSLDTNGTLDAAGVTVVPKADSSSW
jgi:hypothetical protein